MKRIKTYKEKKFKVARPKKMKKIREKTIIGKFIGNARGFGFVTPEREEDIPAGNNGHKDIFIPSEFVNGAYNGDKVEVHILPTSGGKRAEGRISKIILRGTHTLIGTYQQGKNHGFVVPDDLKFGRDIFIASGHEGGAANRDKVVVKITDYGNRKECPIGDITEVLGNESDAGVDIFAIAKGMDIPMEFGPKQMKQAERVPDHVLDSDFEGREDLRDWQLVTIDGPDAKDLDDAVSLTEDEDGGYTLGVHIADVSNYVQEGSALDREAIKRGTSVYLADRVIPMLPVQLSNGICSLNAGVDRLALSVIMKVGARGAIKSHRIVESVIRVGERMSYPDVRAILEEHDQALCERYRDYVPMFERMLHVSKLMRKRRQNRGAIDFDFPEAKVILDEAGLPVDIVAQEANCATKLIEDFMLAANETVAEEFFRKELPFVYRIHEQPDPDKMEELISFVREKGYRIDKKGQYITPKEIQEALSRIEGKPEEPQLSRMILRSMQQARYDTSCAGHFGLAAKYYCHFTSPIRRYPDLQIHRIIHDVIRGRMNRDRIAHYKEILGDISSKCSMTERRAEECERETEKLKKAQYMGAHIGEEFEGVVSSVTGWGMYVELPNTIEGLVPVAEMNDDYYIYNEDHHTLEGRLGGRIFNMGDPVKVRVYDVDLRARTIDFRLA